MDTRALLFGSFPTAHKSRLVTGQSLGLCPSLLLCAGLATKVWAVESMLILPEYLRGMK